MTILSIITISHDDPIGLAATIASLRPQWEMIQSDCQWILVTSEKFTDSWQGPEFLIQPPQGIYPAMNHGLAAASGDYVWFLNGGDRAGAVDLLPKLLAALRQHPDILYGDALELDNRPWRKPAKKLSLMPFGMITHHPAMIFRRDMVPKFDENFSLAADYRLALDCWVRGKQFVYWPEIIAAVTRGGQSEQMAAQGRQEQAKIRKDVLGWADWHCQLLKIFQIISAVTRRILPDWWRRGRVV